MTDQIIDKNDRFIPGGTVAYGARIEIDRVIAKLDRLLAAKKFDDAEAHLNYWYKEAKAAGDKRAEFSVLNELIGFYRRQNVADKALYFAKEGVDHFGALSEFKETEYFGTLCLNAATAYKAFGRPDDALELYRRCEQIYIERLEPGDTEFAGLYNNMGLALADLGLFREAEGCYKNAVRTLNGKPGSYRYDEAITFLNICDLADRYLSETGDNEIDPAPTEDPGPGNGTDPAAAILSVPLFDSKNRLVFPFEQLLEYCIETAWVLLSGENAGDDPYYAFVCEKCAPVFGYYGYFLYDKTLTAAAEEINRRYS